MNVRPIRVAAALLLLLVVPACGRETTAGRQIVEVTLPEPGLVYGDPSAAVVLTEFGSFTCPICLRFAQDVFPELDARHIQPGELRYRYVDVSAEGDASEPALLAGCLSRDLGFPAARRLVFEARAYGSLAAALGSVAVLARADREALSRCVEETRSSGRRIAERQAAADLEVPGTPTFIVGLPGPGGRVVGWVFVGLPPVDTFTSYIRRAHALAASP